MGINYESLPLVYLYDQSGKKRDKTIIKVGDLQIGKDFLVIAGPCSVESQEQMQIISEMVRDYGANMIRGGAYKPRTSPYSFQGLGRVGLEYLRAAGDKVNLPIITEVVDTRDVYLVSEFADVLQIGTRNMQNYSLLQEVGKINKPVLLKRGMNATIEEWLNCAEYIMKNGNNNVILCERGIRTHETFTRNTLDLSAVAALKNLTHLPVVVDPSHATGRRELIESMSLAAIIAGCDGLEIEVHNDPSKALSDAAQQLTPNEFASMMDRVHRTCDFYKQIEGHS